MKKIVANIPPDHDYCYQTEVSKSKFSKTKSISDIKDLQKQTSEVNKAYKAQIEETEDSFQCRCYFEKFCSKMYALMHVRKPECKIKRKNKPLTIWKCQENDCERQFLLRKVNLRLYFE